MTRRRTGSAPRTSNTSDLRSGDSSVESREDTSGNRTTLTFGEMVGIYHDIWNAMLLGGKTTQNLHFPCICISIRASCNSREFSAFQRRENQQLGRIKWPELRRRDSPPPGGGSRGWRASSLPSPWCSTLSRPSPTFTTRRRDPSVRGDSRSLLVRGLPLGGGGKESFPLKLLRDQNLLVFPYFQD